MVRPLITKWNTKYDNLSFDKVTGYQILYVSSCKTKKREAKKWLIVDFVEVAGADFQEAVGRTGVDAGVGVRDTAEEAVEECEDKKYI